MVNVIIPCYNVEKYIRHTIASLKNQTFKNFKVICIDDCSTDNTFNILNEIAKTDIQIEYYKNDKNYGVVKTLNRLISLCDAEWIIRMDADDIFEPQRIELMLNLATQNRLKLVSTFYSYIDMQNNNILQKRFLELCTQNQSIRYMAIFNSPFPSQALFHNSVLQLYKYEEKYKVCEDYYHFVNILLNSDICVGNLNLKLYKYRINLQGLSVTNAKLMRENHFEIARNYATKLLDIQNDELDFLKIGLKLFDYHVSNKVILSSLRQCFIVREKFLNRFTATQQELLEIDRYTTQYFIFLIMIFLKSPVSTLNKFYILLRLSPLIIGSVTNKNIIRWILKNI